MTHICVSKRTTIGSDNGLSPGRRQAIIWTNAGMLLIGALGTNVSEILIEICTFSMKKMLLKMSEKRRSSCLGLNATGCTAMLPQCEINSLWPVTLYGLFGAKPLLEPMLTYCHFNPWQHNSWNLIYDANFKKCRPQNIHNNIFSSGLYVLIYFFLGICTRAGKPHKACFSQILSFADIDYFCMNLLAAGVNETNLCP